MPWDPLVALGIKLLGPPGDEPDAELDRMERLTVPAMQALDAEKTRLRSLAARDAAAAAQLRALLAEEVTQMEAYIEWARGFSNGGPISALEQMKEILRERIKQRQDEIREIAL